MKKFLSKLTAGLVSLALGSMFLIPTAQAFVISKSDLISSVVKAMGLPLVAVPSASCTFTDLTGTEPFYTYFVTACEAGFLTGGGAANPASQVIRAEAAKFIFVAYKISSSIPANPTYRDVPANVWYYEAVESLYAYGVLATGRNRFMPANFLTDTQLTFWLSNL